MNQRKLILFIAVSLDGFIATSEHSLNWLFSVDGDGDNGFSKFYSTVDTVLIGRTTYDWICQNEPDDSIYEGKEVYVFTRTERPSIKHVKFIHENAIEFVKELKSKDGKNIWVVGGGELLHEFIKEKMVDEIIVTIAPVMLGTGIPLFRENDFQTHLLLKDVTQYNQFAELHYEVKR